MKLKDYDSESVMVWRQNLGTVRIRSNLATRHKNAESAIEECYKVVKVIVIVLTNVAKWRRKVKLKNQSFISPDLLRWWLTPILIPRAFKIEVSNMSRIGSHSDYRRFLWEEIQQRSGFLTYRRGSCSSASALPPVLSPSERSTCPRDILLVLSLFCGKG